MSPDWAVAALVGVGHLGILIYLVNVTHAVGWGPRWEPLVKRALVATIVLSTGALGCALYQGGWADWGWPTRGYAMSCLLVSLVAIPAGSLWIRFRPSVGGIAERSSELDLAESHGAKALIGDGRHAWLLRIRQNESLRLRKRDWTLTLPNLPESWDGLSIVQLSDLHFSPSFRRFFFERVADEAAEWPADLVVFTGDLLDHDEALDWIVPVMSRLKGRLGTFSILGNHDFKHRPDEAREQLKGAGFVDLEGRWTELEIEGLRLALGGTSAPWGPRLDFNAIPVADFRLLLSHTPDLFRRAVDYGIDLMLSGHNHGGQIRLPAVGPVLMPSLYSRRFDRGYFRSDRTLLHVSQGVAGQHPIRIGCVPEISRFTLRVGHEQPRHSTAPHRSHNARVIYSRNHPPNV